MDKWVVSCSKIPRVPLSQVTTQTQEVLYNSLHGRHDYNIRKDLFITTPDSKMMPMYPATPETYRKVINDYVTRHNIPKSEMKEFWCEFVDSLLTCYEFEEKAPTDFKAWAYGRLCRYVLTERQQMRSKTAYDPENNFSV